LVKPTHQSRPVGRTKAARVRSGAAKREKAQLLVLKGPEILDGIATNPRSNDRHRIDAVKALDGLADPGTQAAHDDSDRIRVTINLGADHKIAFDRPIRRGPVDDEIIDGTPGPIPGFMIPPNKDDDRGNPI
jgi:hypothetical protein